MFDWAEDSPMRFCRDVSPDDAVDPLAQAMGRPESARPLDRLDDVTLNRALFRPCLPLMRASS